MPRVNLCYILCMTEVRPCEVVTITDDSDRRLLVVQTCPDRLQAGIILSDDGTELVSMPGTYLPQHLTGLEVETTWEIERAAQALANLLFSPGTDAHRRNFLRWQESLERARARDVSFILE